MRCYPPLTSHAVRGLHSSLNGCPKVKAPVNVGFVDAEGTGDRDESYDCKLVTPVLIGSKAVLFNWQGGLEQSTIIGKLAVLAKAAAGLEAKTTTVFGHLHILCRDWKYTDKTGDEVRDNLFAREPGKSMEVQLRNMARSSLKDAFESVTVWLFPPPVDDTAGLRERIQFRDVNHNFLDQVKGLRSKLAEQLAVPRPFEDRALTGVGLSQLFPALVHALNTDEDVIKPQSIFVGMLTEVARKTLTACHVSFGASCDAHNAAAAAAAAGGGGGGDLVSTAELHAALATDGRVAMEEAKEKLGPKGDDIPREMWEELLQQTEARMATIAQLCLEKNDTTLHGLAGVAGDRAVALFDTASKATAHGQAKQGNTEQLTKVPKQEQGPWRLLGFSTGLFLGVFIGLFLARY